VVGARAQGDTVDIAIELVSPATTHRGLYVGATRGRDENRIHVVTETGNRAEARDVLDAVLAHDRADIPAVTQRQALRRQAQPAQPQHLERVSTTPDWLDPWRAQLEELRKDLIRDQGARAPAGRGRRRTRRPPADARRRKSGLAAPCGRHLRDRG
jgi:hypothetical protein